ncbi:MAG: hypothetical protein AB7F51_03935 [Pseudorhodoplanes sp.]
MRNPLTLTGAAAIFALLAAVPAGEAQANGVFTRSCMWQAGIGTCAGQWRLFPPSDPNALSAVLSRSEEMSPEAQERDRRWLERCKPQGRQDQYGVMRLRYAKPGCEFGKTED